MKNLSKTREDKEKDQPNELTSGEDKKNAKKEEKSLFGGIFNGDKDKKPEGLLGNLGKDDEEKEGKKGEEKKEENKNKLFSNTGTGNLFSGSSLFSGTGGSLFSNMPSASSSSLFGSKTLFNFNSLKTDSTTFLSGAKKETDEDENEDDNDLFEGSNSPNAFNPTEPKDHKSSKEKGPYTRKYIKQIDNILVYNKEENKFVSKGNGYLSLEYTNQGKKTAVCVFRYS